LADIKPDNILVNWTCNEEAEGAKTVTDAALGDFDIVYHLDKGELLHTPHAIGNAMWRSPEGQTGKYSPYELYTRHILTSHLPVYRKRRNKSVRYILVRTGSE
jgi:hypothetical protein